MAVKEINEAGGIMVKAYGKKIPVKLMICDDKSDNTTSIQLYEKLVTEDPHSMVLPPIIFNCQFEEDCYKMVRS